MIFYSKSTGFFYDDEIVHSIPDDAVQITPEEHQRLLEGQSAGKLIAATTKGKPKLIDPPPPTAEELSATATGYRDRLLAEAAIRIAPLQDAVDLDDASDVEQLLLKKWKQYRIALNRIEQQPSFPSNITWPEAPQ